ncbi:MAG: hypothetical protein AMXMBFR53_11060 [Gemmatimonadota bacterium]
MNEHTNRQHLSAEALQALLEGELPLGERRSAEEHLASCPRCAAELDAWRVLFRDLTGLPALAPSGSFAERVMAGVNVPEPVGLAARVRGWLGASSAPAHPAGERLQDFAEGILPARKAARMRAHLETCPRCAAEAHAWRLALSRLNELPRFDTSEGFGERVMAQVRVPAKAPARVPEWRRALAWAGRAMPHTRQAWAAVSGVALTPAVTLGLVLWTVFSHPTLTLDALASFAWWKATELAGLAWQSVASAATESAGLFNIYSFFGSLTLSPMAVGGLVAAFSLGTVAATWVLYRNLFAHHPIDARIAHAPLS